MIRYFAAAFAAQLRSSKILTLLTVAGIALGVASVWGIQLINHNAVEAFRVSLDSVTGPAELSVIGQQSTFSETLYAQARSIPGLRRAWPILKLDVGLAGRERSFLNGLGVDFLGEQPSKWKAEGLVPEQALSIPGWVAVSPSLAAREGWTVGSRFDVSHGDRTIRLTVGAIVDFARLHPQATDKMIVMDLAQLQSVFGLSGQLSQIDFQLAEGATAADVSRLLHERLGAGVDVVTPEQREKRASGILEAFRLNLTALSLISLLVGVFLVYMSTQAQVLRRRAEFGLLRTLGATRGQVLAILFTESALLGTVGVALGLPVGYAVARANLESVSATISNLYLLAEVQSLSLSPGLVALGVLIGLGGALGGAAFPAWDMCRKDTVALLGSFTLQEQAHRAAMPMAWMGVGMLALTGLAYAGIAPYWLPANFLLAIGLLTGVILIIPKMLQALSQSIRVTRFGWLYSWKHLDQGLVTIASAVAALAIAVSMLIGITVMIESFRATLYIWARHTIQADIYISPESFLRARELATIDEPFLKALALEPGVAAVDQQRAVFASYAGHRITLSGIRTDLPIEPERFVLREGRADQILTDMRAGAIVIGEPFSRRAKKHVGDTVTLEGRLGPVSYRVAGVFSDFTVDYGTALLDRDTLTRTFGPGPANNAALYLIPGTDVEATADRIKARFADKPLLVRSNRMLLSEIFRLFDQTFAVTRILQVLALGIAACGIALTLLISARERAAELALYAALGATRGQRLTYFLGKGFGMGLVGTGVGLLGGLGLAAILVYAVNRSYFGWTIPLQVPWLIILRDLGFVLTACVAASVWPGLKESGVPATALSREEL